MNSVRVAEKIFLVCLLKKAFLSWEACVGFRIFQRRQTVFQYSWKDKGNIEIQNYVVMSSYLKVLLPTQNRKEILSTHSKHLKRFSYKTWPIFFTSSTIVLLWYRCNLTSLELVLNPHNEGVNSFHFFTLEQYWKWLRFWKALTESHNVYIREKCHGEKPATGRCCHLCHYPDNHESLFHDIILHFQCHLYYTCREPRWTVRWSSYPLSKNSWQSQHN